MEFGSSSSSSSNAAAAADSAVNGLKFGKKIYFEDIVGGGGGGNGANKSSLQQAKKGRGAGGGGGVVLGGGQPPRCQVEGCKVDLSDAKAYYSRHKVCGMHSKSPMVIVAGLEQRFCQQCSRFHQLPEFDQGKRSCRRRLAGHNERRRKPPPGSLLGSRYGNLSSSIFENNSRSSGFLMDFTTYSSLSGRDSWPSTRATEQVLGNQPTATGKFLRHPWQSPESTSSELLLQGAATRNRYTGPGISSGECFGVSDSSRALSLLSNQSWDSRNQSSSLGMNNLLNANGSPVVQASGTHSTAVNNFSSPSWGFKGNESSSNAHEIPPDLGLGQISQAANCQYPDALEMAQQSGRQYLELEQQSRGYDSSVQHMHWSL